MPDVQTRPYQLPVEISAIADRTGNRLMRLLNGTELLQVAALPAGGSRRNALSALSQMPVPVASDAASAALVPGDLARGDYLSAGLNALGVLPLVPALGSLARLGRRAEFDVPTSWGDTGSVEVLRNPTRGDVAKMTKRHGYLRTATEGEDLYVWPGDAVLHEQVARHLGMERFVPGSDFFGADDYARFLSNR